MTAEESPSGRVEVHHVEPVELGEHPEEHRGDDGEVLGHVVGDRERGQRPTGDQQLLADLDDLDQLRRVGVEVDHVPRLLRRLGPRVHRDTDVGLREGGGVVGAVPRHRHEPATGLLAADQRHLVLGRRLGEEVVDPGLFRDGPAVSGLSPVIITVRMPIARS